MTAVIFELVLASKLVGAESAGEGVGRVLGVDVALECRVLVEVRAALAFVGLVVGLLCVIVEGERGLERLEADGAGSIGCARPYAPAGQSAGEKKKKKTHPLDLAPSKGARSNRVCSGVDVPPSINPDWGWRAAFQVPDWSMTGAGSALREPGMAHAPSMALK